MSAGNPTAPTKPSKPYPDFPLLNVNENAKKAWEGARDKLCLCGIIGFAIAAWCLWYDKYQCPLWVGLAIVVALLILAGWVLRSIWPYKAVEGTKVLGLIYMATLTIMAIGRIFEPWLR